MIVTIARRTFTLINYILQTARTKFQSVFIFTTAIAENAENCDCKKSIKNQTTRDWFFFAKDRCQRLFFSLLRLRAEGEPPAPVPPPRAFGSRSDQIGRICPKLCLFYCKENNSFSDGYRSRLVTDFLLTSETRKTRQSYTGFFDTEMARYSKQSAVHVALGIVLSYVLWFGVSKH